MNICIDARVGTKGGTNTFVSNFVRQLNKNRAAIENAGYNLAVVAHPHQNLASDLTVEIPHGRVQEILWSQRGLPKWLRTNRFDIYHSLKHVGPIVCPGQSIYRVPAVGQFDGTYPLTLGERVYWGHLARRVYRRAALLIAVSDYIRNGLVEHLRIPLERVITVHNGVDETFCHLPKDAIDNDGVRCLGITKPFMLCVGNVSPVKNVESSIRAFHHLCADRSFDHDLVIAGSAENAHARHLRSLGESFGIGDRIHFIGFLDAAKLVHVYNSADVFVHMSFHEGFSLSVLEAMSCGVPIVAARTSSIPEAAGEAACYVDAPVDIGQISAQIASVIHSDTLRKSLTEAGLERCRQFTWQACVEKTLALYAQLEQTACAV